MPHLDCISLSLSCKGEKSSKLNLAEACNGMFRCQVKLQNLLQFDVYDVDHYGLSSLSRKTIQVTCKL